MTSDLGVCLPSADAFQSLLQVFFCLQLRTALVVPGFQSQTQCLFRVGEVTSFPPQCLFLY